MKLSKQAFSCLSDEEVEQLTGKQVTVQMQEPNGIIQGSITGLIFIDPEMYETYKHIGQTKYMGVIINNETKLMFDANIDYLIVEEGQDVIDRRAFFRKVATTAVPVIAGIAFSSVFLSSCEKNGGNNPSCSGCANGCDNSCYRSCKTSCSAGCGDGCSGGCATNCVTANCKGGCKNTCGDACSASCVTWQS